MTAEDIKKTLTAELPGKIVELTHTSARVMFLHVAKQDLVAACTVLRDKLGFYHLSTISGRDTGDKLEALYHFARSGMTLTVRAQTERANPSLPTIIGVYPGATYYEREVHDMVGIRIEGHPDMRPLVLPEGWPDGIHPLRKDWQYNREEGVIK